MRQLPTHPPARPHPPLLSRVGYRYLSSTWQPKIQARTYLQLKRLDLRYSPKRWRKGNLGRLFPRRHDMDDPHHDRLAELDLQR